MLVGVPKEIKDNEYRVGLVPSTVRELTDKGHRVLVETGAGSGAGLADADYEAAGAIIVADAEAVYSKTELVVKVKEPLAVERKKLRRDQFCSPICIWLPTAPRPKIFCDRASRRSPTRRSPARQGRYRCLHRCRKWRGEWPRMSARAAWKRRMVDEASCWPAYRVYLLPVSSSSAAASPDPMRR